MHLGIKTILSAGLLILSGPLFAGKIGLGFGSSAEYGGSDTNSVIPLAIFELETPIGIIKNNQIGIELDFVKSTSFDIGPIVRVNFGRDDSVSDSVVAALPTVEAGTEVGFFVGSGLPLARLGLTSDAIIIADVEAVTDVGEGHGGTFAKASFGLVMDVSEDLRFVPSFTINYADEDYTQAFYGVDAANASAGLSAFSADAGVESSQVALVGIRTINERWEVTGIAAYNILRGDAAKSSITERGNDRNFFAGVVVGYKFDSLRTFF